MENKVFDKVVTHSTVFHSDDVFGVAMWKLINPKIEVIRTLDPTPWKDDPDAIIFDIGDEFGAGKYDHHKKEKQVFRNDESKTPRSGIGLMWLDYGHILCPDEISWKRVDDTLIYGIDKADNGVAHNLLSSCITSMNPIWDGEGTPEEEEAQFNLAVDAALILLKGVVDSANASSRAPDYILSCYTGGPVLILDKYCSWEAFVIQDPRMKDVCFCVYPSKRGGWNAQTVKKTLGTYDNRMNFPEEWIGVKDPERGIHFSHPKNFLIGCYTKEQALAVANEAYELGSAEYSVAYSV